MANARRTPSIEYYRKQAKTLAKAHRAGESEALRRAQRVLGERAERRFLLGDAQQVIAVESGLRSWTDLRRAITASARAEREDSRLLALRVSLSLTDWSRRGEIMLDSGMEYLPGSPVRTLIRKREWRYDLSDMGTAVRLAGFPTGWLPVTRRIVEAERYNLGRRGVIFVPTVEGGDLAQLAWRLAVVSQAAFQELLDLDAD